MVNLLATQFMASWILPRRSVWSHPQRFGTLSSHRLCTFISHTVVVGRFGFHLICGWNIRSVERFDVSFHRQPSRRRIEEIIFALGLLTDYEFPQTKFLVWGNLFSERDGRGEARSNDVSCLCLSLKFNIQTNDRRVKDWIIQLNDVICRAHRYWNH